MHTPDQILLVLTTVPDADSANRIAGLLIEAGLAACVSVGAPCRSHYRWQGAVEVAEELPLTIKTTAARFEALQALLRDTHPYELPELLAVPVQQGLPAYLDWVRSETTPRP